MLTIAWCIMCVMEQSRGVCDGREHAASDRAWSGWKHSCSCAANFGMIEEAPRWQPNGEIVCMCGVKWVHGTRFDSRRALLVRVALTAS